MVEEASTSLPFYARGLVVAGFGRGSKQLGIPTGNLLFINCVHAKVSSNLANYPGDVVTSLPDTIRSGIYYGWAMVEEGPVYKMVMSIGWNPVYENEKRSMVCVVSCRVIDLRVHTIYDGDCDILGNSHSS